MSQQEFNQLLKRYLEGQTTEQEDHLLAEWYELPTNQVELPMPEFQKKAIRKRMWRSIRTSVQGTPIRIGRWAWLSGVAACLVLGGYLGFYSQAGDEPQSPIAALVHKQKGMEVKNTNPSEQEVRLPDGTWVLLGQNSSLVYEKTFDQIRREVYLTGEAFFEVKRDVTRPFVVHSGELVTEVLGTSFRIKQNNKGQTTEVSVRTGKVSVYAQSSVTQREHNGLIIKPNQRIVYDARTRNITPGIVDEPVVVLPKEESQTVLLFRETSFEKVLVELTRLYGIEFVVSNPTIKGCHITADLNGLPLFTQLELVCKSIDATYEKRGTVVFINGNGCQ